MFIFLSLLAYLTRAQGQFSGSMKSLINKTYQDSKLIPELQEFEFQEGSLVSDIDDPESITVDVFEKGNRSIVFFSIMEDTINHFYRVMDVVEVTEIHEGWKVRTTFCRQFGVDNVEVIALVKSSQAEYLKPASKAWRFNRDKRKFEALDPAGVDCRQEG